MANRGLETLTHLPWVPTRQLAKQRLAAGPGLGAGPHSRRGREREAGARRRGWSLRGAASPRLPHRHRGTIQLGLAPRRENFRDAAASGRADAQEAGRRGLGCRVPAVPSVRRASPPTSFPSLRFPAAPSRCPHLAVTPLRHHRTHSSVTRKSILRRRLVARAFRLLPGRGRAGSAVAVETTIMAAPGWVGSRSAQHEERADSLESVPTACPASLERPAEPGKAAEQPGRTLWERICEGRGLRGARTGRVGGDQTLGDWRAKPPGGRAANSRRPPFNARETEARRACLWLCPRPPVFIRSRVASLGQSGESSVKSDRVVWTSGAQPNSGNRKASWAEMGP